jgi:lipopolysaccharide transport system permease protein
VTARAAIPGAPRLALLRLPAAVAADTTAVLRRLRLSWRMLLAVARIEFRKKYAGSALGILWYPLYAALLLGVYCFVYMVVFRMRFAEMSSYDFVLFVFSGLVPYLGFSEALATGASSIRGNVALVRNTVFPIELIPMKHLLVSMAGLCVSLAILLLMILPTGRAGWHWLYLPVPIVLLFIFTLAVIWVISAVAALIPDVAHVVNLLLLVLLFGSPIGYTIAQVPDSAKPLLYGNPLTHLIESFRFACIGERSTPHWLDGAFAGGALLAACLAASFFRRLMPLFADHE